MKPILDVCCGSKMFWFNKNNPDVLYLDNRKETHTLCDGRKLAIEPDMVADFKELPFGDNLFKHIVFDPPHLMSAGSNGWQAKKYGSLKRKTWKEEIKKGFDECMRVLEPGGTLIFKWNEHSIKVNELLSVLAWAPLYGHRTTQSSKTIWMAFFKPTPPRSDE